MRDLVIYGAGGHARVVADLVHAAGDFRVLAFVDDDRSRAGQSQGGIPVRGAEFLETLAPLRAAAVVAIGDNARRGHCQDRLDAAGLELPALVHPRATVAREVALGAGSVVFAGAVVQCGCRIGSGVVINTGATVDHDCTLEDFCHIAPGSHLAGGVHVGAGALLGVGCAVLPRTRIGARASAGAGSVLIRDVPAGATVAGNPARELRARL